MRLSNSFPRCVENSAKPCDTGSAVTEMASEFPQVDFSSVDPVWPDKTSPAARRFAYTRPAILARGKSCVRDLYHRPEELIFVVSHSAFLRRGVVGWWFFNSDYRIFNFEHGPEGPALKQHESTLSGGMGFSGTNPVELGSDLPEEDPTV